MLYNFNGTLINVADIVSVQSTKGQRSDYPFVLTVALKNGQQFAVSYATEPSRRAEVNRIAQLMRGQFLPPSPVMRSNRSFRPTPTRSETTFVQSREC